MKRKWEKHHGEEVDKKNRYHVLECQPCGFKHIIPIPDSNKLKQIYKKEYYSIEKPEYFKRSKEDLEWWNLVYSDRYDFFEKTLSVKKRRILDVGSGPGYFLLHGKDRNWNTLGIEPSPQAVSHSQNLGLEIVEGFLNKETAKKLGKFDVVHLSDVLEHIPDPKSLLLQAKSLLNPGGLLCVVVPNDYNPFQGALRTACAYKPWWVAPPHHINYFDFNSLSRLLKKVGVNILHKESTFPIDLFLLMGDNYIKNDSLGRKCHAKRKQFELNMKKAGLNHLKTDLYQAFSNLGLGREVLIMGQKK